MSVVRIRKRIDSDTVTLPELRPFIGRTVEIAIEDAASPAVALGTIPGTGDWATVLAASQQLEDYDYQALVDRDACEAEISQLLR